MDIIDTWPGTEGSETLQELCTSVREMKRSKSWKLNQQSKRWRTDYLVWKQEESFWCVFARHSEKNLERRPGCKSNERVKGFVDSKNRQ